MERFEDLSEDFDLGRALEDLRESLSVFERMKEKNMILGAALSGLGKDRLPSVNSRDGVYGYIPIDLNQFMDMMFALELLLRDDPDYGHSEKQHRPCNFLEVGCGPGRNLHVLGATDRFILEKISGFDIEKEFVDFGRGLFDLGDDIFVDDALSFDYGGYDIIYFYRPFHDDKLQLKFEKRLIETAKSGAYILAQLDSELEKSRNLVVKDAGMGIFKRL